MPRTKSNCRRQRNQQGSVRRSTRSSTRASSGTTAGPAPCGTGSNTQPQPDPLAEGTLTNLLDLIRDHVRAELQAQQAGQEATATQAGHTSVTERTGQLAVTGQATVGTSQPDPIGTGMLIWVNIKHHLVIVSKLQFKACMCTLALVGVDPLAWPHRLGTVFIQRACPFSSTNAEQSMRWGLMCRVQDPHNAHLGIAGMQGSV